MKIGEFIKDLFKSKYKYVPPCPRCGSFHTGFFVKVSTVYVDKIYIQHANNGELVRCVDSLYYLPHNAFCDECGAEWNAAIELKEKTPELIQMEKERRGISPTYKEEFDADFVLTNKERRAVKKSKQPFIKGRDNADEIIKSKRRGLRKLIPRGIGSSLPFYDEISDLTLKNKVKRELKEQIDDEFKQYGV